VIASCPGLGRIHGRGEEDTILVEVWGVLGKGNKVDRIGGAISRIGKKKRAKAEGRIRRSVGELGVASGRTLLGGMRQELVAGIVEVI